MPKKQPNLEDNPKNIRLALGQLDELKKIATVNVTVSGHIRIAIDEYLEKNAKKEPKK
ncbi:MAG: hypothetical protein WC373_01740 [Smithella sp.]|jgi:hypothetical protein